MIPILPREAWHDDVLDALNAEERRQWRQLVRECSARVSETDSGVIVKERRSSQVSL